MAALVSLRSLPRFASPAFGFWGSSSASSTAGAARDEANLALGKLLAAFSQVQLFTHWQEREGGGEEGGESGQSR